MIITLVKADFSANNIGTLSSFNVLTNLGKGCVYNGPTSVERNGSLSATITISNAYVLNGEVLVKMGSTVLSSGVTINGNTITLTISNIDGNISITVPTKAIAGETPEIPDTPTPEEPVVIDPRPGHPKASGATMPADGILTQDMFTVLQDTWMQGSSLTWQTGDTGNTIGYASSYLPIPLDGYTSIEMTAQPLAATYYQFTDKEDTYTLMDTRAKIDKGTTATVTIPAGAKYLIMADHRTNSSDANAVNGYLLYFPASMKIS
jgi:hypothetical protein